MKQTIPLLLVASASTSFFAASLMLPEARVQAQSPPSVSPPAPPTSPSAASAAPSASPAARPPYPPAQPVGQTAPTSPSVPPTHAATGTARAGVASTTSPSSSAAALPPATKPGVAAPAPASPTAPPAGVAAASAFAGPTPPEELATFFKGADGIWRCDGKMPAGVGGPGSAEIPYKSTVKLKRDLGGFWIAGDYEIKKSKTTPGAQARFFIGFDPRTKQFISASFDSLGGMDRGGSPGLQGNALALTGAGTVNGMKVQTRSTLTFTKPGKELDYRFELDRGQGFQLVGEDSCKKLGGGPVAGAPAAGGPGPLDGGPGAKVAAPVGGAHPAGPPAAPAAPR